MTDIQLKATIRKMDISLFEGISAVNLAKLTRNFTEEYVRRVIAKSPYHSGQKSLIKIIREKYIEWKKETDITYNILPSTHGWKIHPKYMEDLYFRIDCGEYIEAEECTMIGSGDDANSSGEELGLSKLKSRIAELEEENEALKEQVEHYRNMEKGTALGLNQAQAALFGESLANTFGFQYTNKKKQLAPMLHKLFGWGQTKLETCLSTPCDKEKRDELANLFKELCPPLYETIMRWGKLPQ